MEKRAEVENPIMKISVMLIITATVMERMDSEVSQSVVRIAKK
jgi:hypothetical protein